MNTQVNTQASQAYNARTGAVLVKGEPVLIARESDFRDFMEEAPAEKVHSLRASLELAISQFGEARSVACDLLRQRLREVRSHIQSA
jgi:hypothetical protein